VARREEVGFVGRGGEISQDKIAHYEAGQGQDNNGANEARASGSETVLRPSRCSISGPRATLTGEIYQEADVTRGTRDIIARPCHSFCRGKTAPGGVNGSKSPLLPVCLVSSSNQFNYPGHRYGPDPSQWPELGSVPLGQYSNVQYLRPSAAPRRGTVTSFSFLLGSSVFIVSQAPVNACTDRLMRALK
jgi:hypothetical protein